MKASTFCQLALTCYETQGQYIEEITQWHEDMNIRVVKTIFYEQLMLPPCNVYYNVYYMVRSRNKPKTKKAPNQAGVILRENTRVFHVFHIFSYLH